MPTSSQARGDRSLELGAIAFHRERGSDPAAGVAALRSALERCLLLGCYDAVLDLCPRALALMDWDKAPRECWLVVAKWVTALTAMGRPDEAAALYDDACSRTADPLVHLQAAYGRAMLYTRFYEKARRDHAKAKAEINIAIAISSLLDDERRRTFNQTFNENGLALIEMHLGDLHEALRLVDGGLERIGARLRARRARAVPLRAALQPRAAAGARRGRAGRDRGVRPAHRRGPQLLRVPLRPRRPASQARPLRGGARRPRRRDPAQPAVPRAALQPRRHRA